MHAFRSRRRRRVLLLPVAGSAKLLRIIRAFSTWSYCKPISNMCVQSLRCNRFNRIRKAFYLLCGDVYPIQGGNGRERKRRRDGETEREMRREEARDKRSAHTRDGKKYGKITIDIHNETSPEANELLLSVIPLDGWLVPLVYCWPALAGCAARLLARLLPSVLSLLFYLA